MVSMAWWSKRIGASRRQEDRILKIIVAARYTLILSSLMEIAGTVYLSLHGPRDNVAERSNILMLVAVRPAL